MRKTIIGKIVDFREKYFGDKKLTEIGVFSEKENSVNIMLRGNYKLKKGTNVKVTYVQTQHGNLSVAYTDLDMFRIYHPKN